MAKSAPAAPAPPPVEIQGGGAGRGENLPGRTETWGEDSGSPIATSDVVEMDGGHGEQNKAEQIMQALRGDGSLAELTSPTTSDVVKLGTEEKTDEPAVEAAAEKPPTRKDLLKAIDSEKRARVLEAQLKVEQAKNKVYSEGDIAQIAAAKGISREKAMEQIVLGGVSPVVDPNPEVTALKAEVARLKTIADDAENAKLESVVTDQIKDIDVPMVKAIKRVPMPQANGTAIYKSTHDVITELAEQLWVNEGSPAQANPRDYLAPAAKLLEKALQEEFGGLVAAKTAPKAPASVPAVGKRSSPARQTSSDEFAGMDDYTRRLAIAKRFGV